MKKMLILGMIASLFIGCETGYKVDSNRSQKSENLSMEDFDLHYQEEVPETKFEGGYINDGLDLGAIRVSESRDAVRLVLDSYRLDASGKRVDKVNRVGVYSFVYYPEKRLLSGSIHGYRKFSANLPHFAPESIIEKIYMDKNPEDTGFRFHIKFRDNVNVKVFDLKNPGRIVIDAQLF